MKKNLALLLLLALVLTGCKDFSFYGVLGDRIDDTPLQISPAAIVVSVGATIDFTATGGLPPYTYIVATGPGSFSANTYSASSAGLAMVRVRDSKGRESPDAAVTVNSSGAALAISPTVVHLGPGGSLTFVASGGVGSPPVYTFTSGSPWQSGANPPTAGSYAAGPSLGTDSIELTDGSTTVTATVYVETAVVTVNYDLDEANFVLPSPITGGSPIAAGSSFRIVNAPDADGTQPISWWVYLSDDGSLGSGDSLLDAGTTAGGLSAGTGADVPFTGDWPLASGTRYLFVMVAAADDYDPGNNVSAAVPLTFVLPNYTGTVAYTSGTTAGAAFAGTLTIDNVGTADGTRDVYWSVYASLGDTAIDLDDKIVATGTISGGMAMADAPAVLVINNTWPLVVGNYYLVAEITAADEIDTTGNQPATGAVTVIAAPAPAVDYSGTVSTGAPTRAGGAFTASLTITNGPAAAGSSTVHWSVYASLDNTTIEAGDKLVGAGSLAGLPASGSSGALPISSSWPLATGSYCLVAQIQADDETAPANNTPASAAVNVGATDYSGVVAHSGGTTAGAAFTANLTISNISGAYALAGSQDLYWNVYASLGNTTIDAADKVVGAGMIAGGLVAGGSSGTLPIANTWPTTAGTYYLIADIFAGDDADIANNKPVSAGIAVAAPPAANVDYSGVVVHSTGFTAGAAFTGTLTINNGPTSAGTEDVGWSVYASLGNATLDAGDTLVASGTIAGGLSAGGSSGALAIANTWPATAGTYYLVADIQAFDDVNTANNRPASGAVTVNAPPAPPVDYSGTVSTGAPTRAGGSFTASLTITNGPAAAGSSTVYWSVYASLGNTTIEAGDKLVGSGSLAGLPASGSSGALPINSSWPLDTGSYYLVAQILADDDANTANNRPFSAAVNVGATDYSGVVAHSGGTTAGAAFTGTLTINNISGPYALAGSQDLYWNVYASLGNTNIDAADKVVGAGTIAGGLAAGGSSGALAIANTWPTTTGTYYLIADIFAGDDANTANNKPVSAGIAVAAPPAANVDYSGVVVHSTGFTAGAAFTGTLTITNIGSDGGSSDISWSVYASRGNGTIGVGDSLVASGTIVAGLSAGNDSGALAIANTWPATAGTYYLVADIQALDDVNPANDQPASAAVVVAPSALLVDYSGTVSTGAPTRAGGSFAAALTVNNGAAAAGASTVYWSVYASLGDTAIDAGDKLVGSGSFPGLPPLGSSGALAINSSWPLGTGSYYLVAQILADDDANTANNTPASAAVNVGATDYSGVVTHNSGTTAGASFTFSLTINNVSGTYALAGSQDIYWNVYASRGDSQISVDDKIVGSGIVAGGLAAGGSFASGVLNNTWPATPGTYYLIADIFAGDDANTGNNRPTASVGVTAPLPPDYGVSFSTDPPWSALVGTAIGGQIRIQNLSANLGLQPITYSIYRSADKVLGGDTLLLTNSQAALGGGAFVDVPAADGDLWPAGGQFWYLIAAVSAADDAELSNNTIISHPVAAADGRYVEGLEDNGDSGPTPPAFSAVSLTGLTLNLNGTIALEGTMDAYIASTSQYDTYKFLTGAGVGGVSMKARWQTGYDDVDMYLWDENKNQVQSIATDVDSEPAGVPNLNIIGISAANYYYVGLNFWLANNTSGSAGRKYVVLIKGNAP